MTTIAVFVGSLRAESHNKALAKGLEALLPEDVTFDYVSLDLPLYNSDLEADFPAAASAVKTAVETADGVLFVTPEHNRSFPAALKNAIDWASRPWGTNSFNGKPAAIIGITTSGTGTAQAQQQLRNVMLYLNTKLLGQPEVYLNVPTALTENGGLSDKTREALDGPAGFIETFVAHVKRG